LPESNTFTDGNAAGKPDTIAYGYCVADADRYASGFAYSDTIGDSASADTKTATHAVPQTDAVMRMVKS